MYLSVPINMFIWNCQWEMLWFITAWVPLEWNKHSSTTEWLQGCSCPSLTYISLHYFTDKLSDRSENYLFQLYFIATYNSTLIYQIFFFLKCQVTEVTERGYLWNFMKVATNIFVFSFENWNVEMQFSQVFFSAHIF